MAMLDSIMQFLAPILAKALGTAASTGVNQLMAPPVNGGDPGSIRQGIQQGQFSRQGLQSGQQVPGQGGSGLIPGMPPGVSGSGTTNNPSGGMNFGGGYTGGPTTGNAPAGPPSSGFTTMGFPSTDQSKLRQGLRGNDSGFQGI